MEKNLKNATVYIIEGIDGTGKSSLVEGIQQRLGFFQVIHFGKPKVLEAYRGSDQLFRYQSESFLNAMLLARVDGARLIYDRSWIGEACYADMYRGYPGDYVFDYEKDNLRDRSNIILILLVEDFSCARHFIDDGLSLGSIQNRHLEQDRFLEAFKRSWIENKKLICVTDRVTGGFKSKEAILDEALE